MMKKMFFGKPEETGFADSVSHYVMAAAILVFLYMAFPDLVWVYYEQCLMIPCLMLLGIQMVRRPSSEIRKTFLLPGAMVIWFLFLQGKRFMEHADLDNIGLFLTTYLFAFPLASLLQDGDKKRALKIFAGACVAAAAMLSVGGLLLIADCLPGFLEEHIFWDGGRLTVFWHPNVGACYLMMGIVFCTAFLAQEKSWQSKTLLSVLLVLMIGIQALTGCGIVIILTGGYLSSFLFFGAIRRGRKWFVPGIFAVLILTAAFHEGAMYLDQINTGALIKKYSEQYAQQITQAASEGEEWTFDAEQTLPIAVDPDTGEVYLTAQSSQGSASEEFGTWDSRTYVWSAAKFAIRETPSILYWGMHNPGDYISYYNFFPVSHLYNAWWECLVGLGVVGFLIAMIFTLITVWNSLMVLLRHHRDIWKRSTAILALCLMAAAVLEPYLFYATPDYHLVDFLFFLCSGYLFHWQEADNRCIMSKIRGIFLSAKT